MRVSMSWQIALAAMMFLALSVPLAEAQVLGRGQGGTGRGRGAIDGQGGRYYDPGTEISVTGTVEEVLMQAGRAGATGLHLLVQDGEETYDVHVGPTFYLFPEGLEVQKGDQVSVTGSRIDLAGQPALIVKEISKGDFNITLRDDIGVPLWRGQGPRAAQGGRGPGAVVAPGGAVAYGRGYTGTGGRGYGRASFARGGGRGVYGAGVGRGATGRGLGRGPCGRGLGRGYGRGLGRGSGRSVPAAVAPPATGGGGS
jgi:hypothetical protein